MKTAQGSLIIQIRKYNYAVALGVKIIEKHFKIDEGMECIDAPVSITEEQMRTMVTEIRNLKNNGRKFSWYFRKPKETAVLEETQFWYYSKINSKGKPQMKILVFVMTKLHQPV